LAQHTETMGVMTTGLRAYKDSTLHSKRTTVLTLHKLWHLQTCNVTAAVQLHCAMRSTILHIASTEHMYTEQILVQVQSNVAQHV
jgi:hypothetical protein